MATVSKEMLQKHKQPMTHDELLAKIDYTVAIYEGLSVLDTRVLTAYLKALRAVVELHKPYYNEGLTVGHCKGCQTTLDNITRHVSYPCPTIQAIEKELG